MAAIWGNAPAEGVSFTSPNGIAIDSSDNVYVTEFRGNRVQKFTSDGVPVAQWGSKGSEGGQFQNPTGIAIDGEGNIYVSESGNHRVQKFTSDGKWLTGWGSRGYQVGFDKLDRSWIVQKYGQCQHQYSPSRLFINS